MKYYSDSTKGFYAPEVHITIPDDAIGVNEDHYNELLAGQATGAKIIIVKDGEVLLEDVVPSEDEAVDFLRKKRNELLLASDWTQLADAQVDKGAWATYRQELRDLPQNTTDPFNPVWPVAPT